MLQTAISDLEVVQVEHRGSFQWSRDEGIPFNADTLGKVLDRDPNGHLYYFDYPIVTEEGVETNQVITIATTRPETMLADRAVAVHPTDQRYADFVKLKRCVRLPLVNRHPIYSNLIPIIADDYSDPEKGTGAVKITPAHDFNDFEVGKRHKLESINILTPQARIISVSISENPAHDELSAGLSEGDLIPSELQGLDRFRARVKVVQLMEKEGRLNRIEPHTHQVPHGDRSGAEIEPYLTDQWYVDAKTLAQPALTAVREGKTKLIPKNWEKTYFDWLENIQPWCISRQLWWGHQIPVWYGPKMAADGSILVRSRQVLFLRRRPMNLGHSLQLPKRRQ